MSIDSIKMDVSGSGVDITPAILDHVSRKIEFSLDRFAEKIQSISTTLEDVNGPRGGVDQTCRVNVQLTGRRQPVIATALHEEIGGAIEQAFDKVSQAVARKLDRKLSERRRQPVPQEAV